MSDDKYILDGHTPVKADLMTWAKWYENTGNRRVALTEKGGVKVSTVFLGLDHGRGDGPPLLFATMIFGGGGSEYQVRSSTWDEALAAHEKACKIAFPAH